VFFSLFLSSSVCCLVHGDAHAGNMLWCREQQHLTLIDLPTLLHATRVEVEEGKKGQGQGQEQDGQTGKFRIEAQGLSSSAASPLSLLLSGCGLSARDVCLFERKLHSHGSRRGLTSDELLSLQSDFRSAYVSSGGAVSPAARRFFDFRSLMGEITQLVKYEPTGIMTDMIQQLRQIMAHTQAEGQE
jgi:hypothetical protein